MTRKELVEALTANFKEDEEVTFVYNDDKDEVRETRAKVTDHTEKRCNGHYELFDLDTGMWVSLSINEFQETLKGLINKDRFRTIVNGLYDYIWVTDGPDIEDTKKVVYIG